LSFAYANLNMAQLFECTSRGLLRDYALVKKFALASMLLAIELLPLTGVVIVTAKALTQLCVCVIAFKPGIVSTPEKYQKLPGDTSCEIS
jgi:hypothetical protein